MTLIDVVLALGVGVILPMALGGPRRWWIVASVCVLAACVVDGPALAVPLTLPLGLLAAGAAVRAVLAAALPWRWGGAEVAGIASAGFALVAWIGLVASCAGLQLLGVADPFNQLAAVHFTYVGGGAVPMAASAWADVTGSSWHRVGQLALGLTIGAPPVVAIGFIADQPVVLVAGALLVTGGVWATGLLELRRAVGTDRPLRERILYGLSGAAVVVPMVLAVLWSMGQQWDVPVLSIDEMVRTHGAANAVGFVGAGLVALHLENRRLRRSTEVAAWS